MAISTGNDRGMVNLNLMNMPLHPTAPSYLKHASAPATADIQAMISNVVFMEEHPNKKLTKALNSFIAFRCYYSPMFEPLQQKVISGVIQVLWHADQYKAIWQVIAKAYSIIRDVKGKENAPLNTFLELAAPFAGIIAPGNYFIALGWKLLIDHEGQVMLSKDQVFDIGTSCANIPGCTVSVVDVIMYCVGTGYATMENYDLALTTNEQSMMALTIPNTGEVSHDRLGGDASQVNTIASTNVADRTGLEPWEYNMAVDLQEGIALLNAQIALDEANATAEVVQDVAAANPVSALNNLAFSTKGVYPFNGMFHPAESRDAVVFNPYKGSHFNTFEMSDWINPEALDNGNHN